MKVRKFLQFFDILEDKIRCFLSNWPVLYAILGIVGLVLTWRGVWYLADEISVSPLISITLGLFILLSSGLLVALAIGDEVLITAFRGKKKVSETQIEEAFILEENIEEIKKHLSKIESRVTLFKREKTKLEKKIIENKNDEKTTPPDGEIAKKISSGPETAPQPEKQESGR